MNIKVLREENKRLKEENRDLHQFLKTTEDSDVFTEQVKSLITENKLLKLLVEARGLT